MLKEAGRLHALGFSIHWLRPKSKIPIDSGWGKGPRKSWDLLQRQYVNGMNLGVRLGTPSLIGDLGYLAVIDVDVKSENPQHRQEALKAVKLLISHNLKLPEVSSGRGNGSCHFYCLTKAPFKTFTPYQSQEMVRVLMPSKKASKKELETFSEKEIKEGWRLSHAWEISLYSDGRQVVLPPSIHPDSGKEYVWISIVEELEDLPILDFSQITKGEPSIIDKPVDSAPPIDDIEFETVDLGWIDIPGYMRSGIIDGTGVEDRSKFILSAGNALFSAGLSRDEILSVLTDSSNFISGCAYEHAKTRSRKKAAEWLWKYTVHRVFKERDAQEIFKEMAEVVPLKILNEEEAKKQAEEIAEERDWKQDLDRTKGGYIANTLKNTVMFTKNMVAPNVFKRNRFALKDVYGMNTPWGGRVGQLVTDDDKSLIKHWLGKDHGFEPSDGLIYDMFTVIACENSFDPVQDWLNALPEWDGERRLSGWLKTNFEAEGPEEYLDQVFSKWMTAMVKRAFVPGFKFDWMPIFQGYQAKGKSSFGRILVGDDYFLDWLPKLNDKDAALGLQGHWCVEMGELANFRATELEDIKAFVVRTVDKFRPPHGRKLIESPRRCVFFGTTNKEKYLKDETGNRRFKPVVVGQLNFKALERDRTQLFAEAMYLHKNTLKQIQDFELVDEAKIFEAKIHAEKMVDDESDVMFELMQDFIEKVKKGDVEFNHEKFRMSELFRGEGALGSRYHQNTRNMMFAAKMLKKFKGESRHIVGYKYWKIDLGEALDEKGITDDFF